MRAQTVLDCGALRGAAKSYVLAIRVALSAVLAVATVACGVDRRQWHGRDRSVYWPIEKRSCRRGHKREVRARCVGQIGAESRPCPPLRLDLCGGMAARRSMDM